MRFHLILLLITTVSLGSLKLLYKSPSGDQGKPERQISSTSRAEPILSRPQLENELETPLSQFELCIFHPQLSLESRNACYDAFELLQDHISERTPLSIYLKALYENSKNSRLTKSTQMQNLGARMALLMYEDKRGNFCQKFSRSLLQLSQWCNQFDCDCAIGPATLPLDRCEYSIPKCSLSQKDILQRLYEFDLDDQGVSHLYFSWLTTHGHLKSAKKSSKVQTQ